MGNIELKFKISFLDKILGFTKEEEVYIKNIQNNCISNLIDNKNYLYNQIIQIINNQLYKKYRKKIIINTIFKQIDKKISNVELYFTKNKVTLIFSVYNINIHFYTVINLLQFS